MFFVLVLHLLGGIAHADGIKVVAVDATGVPGAAGTMLITVEPIVGPYDVGGWDTILELSPPSSGVALTGVAPAPDPLIYSPPVAFDTGDLLEATQFFPGSGEQTSLASETNLFLVTFEVDLGVGIGSIFNVDFDSEATNFSDGFLVPQTIDSLNGGIITIVPEPTSGALIALGVLISYVVLASSRRRRTG